MDTQTIQQALQQLYELGMTDDEIGREINAAQSIVTRLRNGIHKSTSFERGQKIFDLLKKRAKPSPKQSPRASGSGAKKDGAEAKGENLPAGAVPTACRSCGSQPTTEAA